MNASSSVPMPHAEIPLRTALPGYLGDPARPRFAWLHRPPTPATVGMVIVPPFGFESVCSHRTMRHLAESAATAGVAAVRIDLDGTGDSAGSDHDAERWEAWLSSIDDACDLLLAQGVQRLVLAGIRLGGALATHAALRRGDIDGLVTIAAVVSGKAYLREARVLQMAMDLAPAPPSVTDDGIQEVAGFAITAETRAAIAAIDLLETRICPAASVLVLDRDDLPPQEALARAFRALGAKVQQQSLPGYTEMMLDPHRTEIPQSIVEACIAFTGGFAEGTHQTDAVPDSDTLISRSASIQTDQGPVVEETVDLEAGLFGILTRPPTESASRIVILLNAGAVGHIGPNRMYVQLARRIAASGDLALRLDLSGLGDSPPRMGDKENFVYGKNAVADIAIGVEWARRQGIAEVVVAGLCSGAYHAYQAAVSGQDINRIVMVNPLTFHYTPGLPLDLASFHVTAETQRYGSSLHNAASWKKLLRGDVNVLRVSQVMMRRARDIVENKIRNLARSCGMRMRDDLGGNLAGLAQRGVGMQFVFSASDPGQTMLREQGGSTVSALTSRGALTMTVVEGADHTFTSLWMQPIFIGCIMHSALGLVGV